MKIGKSMVLGGAVGFLAPAVLVGTLGGQRLYRSQLPHIRMAQASLKRQLQWWTYDPSTGQILADLLTGKNHRRRGR